MPDVSVALTWAIPVDVVTLGAHLHAYVTIARPLHMLRLCYYFGQGAGNDIAKLPAQLFSIIEQLLLDERLRMIEEWQEACLCFEQRCHPKDHLTDGEVEQLLKKFKSSPDSRVMRNHSEKDLTDDQLLGLHLWYFDEEWISIHRDLAAKWKGEKMVGTKEEKGIFHNHREFVWQHFGLDIWVSRVRHDDPKPHQEHWDPHYQALPFEETIAYITYRQDEEFQGLASFSHEELTKGDFTVESGYAMGVEMPPPLSAADRARFTRMMRVLDLEPCEYTEELHQDNKLIVQPQVKKKAKPKASSWPRLTLLTKVWAACYEMPL